MLQISAVGNTMAPCWVVLEVLGYAVSVKRTADKKIWIAQKAEEVLNAHDPCALLGLSKLVEVQGQNWQISDEQITDFLQRFYSE